MIGRKFDIGTLGRAATLRALGVAAALAALGGCASGSGGGAADDERAPVADQRRSVVRVAGHRPVEIYNEAGLGVRTVEMAAATVWGVVGGVYADLEIPVEASDPTAMRIGNKGYRARRIGGSRMNAYVDCGSDLAGPLANQYDITLAVATELRKQGDETTQVLTTVDAYGRPRAVSGNPIHCQSRGALETLIAERIAAALGLPSG